MYYYALNNKYYNISWNLEIEIHSLVTDTVISFNQNVDGGLKVSDVIQQF